MSSRISRRQLFKLGALGGGVVAAGGIAVGVKTLSTSGGKEAHPGLNHPWWVKTVDIPTMRVDEKTYRRFNGKAHVLYSFMKYVGREKAIKIFRNSRKKRLKEMKEKKPGYRLEEKALFEAGWTVYRTGNLYTGIRSWERINIATPEEQGVEKWKGSPQEAAMLVKRGGRFYGAAQVGIAKLDRRHIFTEEKGYKIVFENVDQPYKVDSEKLVIPKKCKWVIAVSVQMSLDAIQCAPSMIAAAASTTAYSRAGLLVATLAEYIRGLGYTAIPSVNELGSSVAVAVDAGLGELGRTNRLITPIYGPNVRLAKVLTDMPMSTDKPVDFGLKDFCRVCKRCAEVCPSKALSMKDDPDFKVRGGWNNPGHEAWFEDSTKCFEYWMEVGTDCGLCLAVCPWSKKDKTVIHEIVKASSAKMPFLAGTFTEMDRAFGYGRQRDPNDWWEKELPEFGIDTALGKE